MNAAAKIDTTLKLPVNRSCYYGGAWHASTRPDGVAITDSLSLVRDAPVERWAPQAARAGADMLLFTSPAHARRAVRALLPLARSGALDAHVERIERLATRSRR